MRVSRDSEKKREAILDAAEELFAAKGYDSTSTNDILDRIGIARGTLYYYYKSKEEILDAVIERITNRLLDRAAVVAENTNMPLLDRLPLAILAMNVSAAVGNEVMRQLYNPSNALMQQKMQRQLLNGIVPIITKLVREGVEADLFHTDRPVEAVEMCMLYANTVFGEGFSASEEERTRRVAGFIYNFERLLGTEEGALTVPLIRLFAAR